MIMLAAASSTPAPYVGGTAAPVAAVVPVKLFGIMFIIILAAFLIWYFINRRA